MSDQDGGFHSHGFLYHHEYDERSTTTLQRSCMTEVPVMQAPKNQRQKSMTAMTWLYSTIEREKSRARTKEAVEGK